MTKRELVKMNIEIFDIRARKELDNMADDANVDRFIRCYHIRIPDPDMIAWQEVQKARTALAELRKGEPIDLMLASAGLVEDDEESELEKKLRKIIADNWDAAQRWERWTGSKR